TAKLTLQSRFNFSDRQCDAILSMPLRRLTGLERQQLQTEFDELSAKIEELQRLLGDRHELLKALKKDLRALKRKYGDQRRTRIQTKGVGAVPPCPPQDRKSRGAEDSKGRGAKNATPQLPITNDPLPEEEVVLEFTHKGYVRRLSKNGKSTTLKAGDDFAVKTQASNTGAELVVITDSGKAYPVKVKDIPQTSGQSRGTPLPLLLPNGAQAANETIATYFLLPPKLDNADLIIFTSQGRIKRLPATEIASLSARGMTLIKLKDNDKVSYASVTNQRQEVILATSGGRVLRFQINEQQLPLMGRTAQGIQAVRLRSQEKLVGGLTLAPNENILLVSALGYAKRMPVSALRLVNIGEIGSQMMQFIGRIDNLAAMVAAKESAEVTLVTERRTVRVGVKSVHFYGKDGMGDRIVQLNPDEKIVNVVIANG
ncbi:MAG TPA: DNA topoisomerase IV, partial [Cyanobacteria bacterium UBA11372]|nr:DNA topoisomerase IV [Cyanobacteria bacterium UBA11372]